MFSPQDQWLLLLLNYVLHSSLLVALALILVRFKAVNKPLAREHLWKFVLIGGFVTTLIQAQIHTSLFKISTGTTEPIVQKISTVTDDESALRGFAYAPSEVSLIEPLEEEEALSSPKEFVLFWVLLVGLFSLLFILHFIISRNRFLKDLQMTQAEDPTVRKILDELSIRFQLNPRIQLFSSTKLKSPIAISSRRICIPERSLHELNNDQMESILAHEVAHIVRKDPQWLFFMNIVINLFWFQPLNRLVRHNVKQAMEDGADRMAVNLTNDPITFSETLLAVARWGQSPNTGNYALSLANTSSLKNRVRAVLTIEKEPRTNRFGILLVLVPLLTLVSFACPEVSLEDGLSTETEEVLASKEPESKTVESSKVEPRDKQLYQVPSSLKLALHTSTISQNSSLEMTPVSLANLNTENTSVPESATEKSTISTATIESLAELPLPNNAETIVKVDQDRETESSDRSPDPLETMRLLSLKYERFKRDFWPMLITSGLLNKRVNSVELTYNSLSVNGSTIRGSKSQRFRLLIETHFDQSHWGDFQYRRDGLKTADMKRSMASAYTAEPGREGPSEWRDSRKLDRWKEYRSELAQNLLEDGVIQSISDNISIKWRKDKVFINRKKFKGADFLKYRSIKDKHFSTRAT
ncbi:MAG: M56 family metallopeptidase [Roseivirga sp.]|nr:M56 family metallopeptidase [Roseivirga sp.]